MHCGKIPWCHSRAKTGLAKDCQCPKFSREQIEQARVMNLTIRRAEELPIQWRYAAFAGVSCQKTRPPSYTPKIGKTYRVPWSIRKGQPKPEGFTTRCIGKAADGVMERKGEIQVVVEALCMHRCHVQVRLPDGAEADVAILEAIHLAS